MPLGFHWYELLPLVLIALLIFGPKKLPELGSSIGKTIKEFQKSMKEEPQVTPPPAAPSVAAPAPMPAQPQVTAATPASSLSAPDATPTAATTAETPVQ